jgi:16S rRNA pseudouridine516 synthase
MELERMLRSQGFGSRAECRALVCAGRVSINGRVCTDASLAFEPEGLRFVVDGVEWCYCRFAYLALHKPAGYECSRHPGHHPSVYSLLPWQLVARGVQAVGRLDQDTTGLLLFTDDGPFIHHCTSPRKQVPKVYEVTTRESVDDAQVDALLNGVVLHGEAQTLSAAACSRLDDRRLRLTVTLGKYHLVKRMVAAAGNSVEGLHRVAIGGLLLPASLSPGQWVWLGSGELRCLTDRG